VLRLGGDRVQFHTGRNGLNAHGPAPTSATAADKRLWPRGSQGCPGLSHGPGARLERIADHERPAVRGDGGGRQAATGRMSGNSGPTAFGTPGGKAADLSGVRSSPALE